MVEATNELMFEILKKLQTGQASLESKLDAVLEDTKAIRIMQGTIGGLQHDINVLANRSKDHEKRIKELETH